MNQKLNKIWSALKSFTVRIFGKFIGAQPEVVTVLTAAQNTLLIVAPIIETTLTVCEGAAVGTVATGIITIVQADIKAAIDIATDLEKVQTFKELLDVILKDLSDLLTLAAIKNSTKSTTITSNLTAAITAIESIMANVSKL